MMRKDDSLGVPVPPAWNGVSTEYPRHRCIHSLFEEQAALTPDAVALEFNSSIVTYSVLNQMANATARALIESGMKPGTRVAVVQQRSPEFIAALLGISKAGGVYVPVDLDLPDERIRLLFNDASLHFVLGSGAQRTAVARLQIETQFIDLSKLNRSIDTENNPDVNGISPTDPAYVLYTSGSTGTPKGVVVSHRSIVRLIRNTNYVTITPQDVFLHLAPASFDASTFEIFAPLLNGARLVIAPPGELGLGALAELIEKSNVTILWLTAGLFHAMVDDKPEALRKVRQLLAGGDVLSPTHVRRALSVMENGCVINGYGPTENTTFTCCFRVTHDTAFSGSVPVGFPIANTSVYILDSKLHPLPVGEIGEIFIAGDGLALGYLNRPELNAERFVANPFGSHDCGLLFRSGDLGRFTPTGAIEFCGRTDDQVKIRGYRVEPGEVEAAVMRVDGIANAIVVAVSNPESEKSLVCHFVASPGLNITSQKLRSRLELMLPAYMIPSQYRQWDRFPLTANGKVDRRLLLESGAGARPIIEAADSTEQALLSMFRDLLHRQDISVEDDFFDIGGHSLAAARLFTKIEEHFGRRLPLAILFEAPSARRLAALLRDDQWRPEWPALVPIRSGGSRPPVFLVHAIGGNVLSYGHLHSHLPADQPIYAFQATALKYGRMSSTSIEEVAAHYLAELRSVQPEGPYFLGGFSSGGVLAYEMAQQLLRAGQQVAIVLLFDSHFESSAMGWLRTFRFSATSRVIRTLLGNIRLLRRTGLKTFARSKTHNISMNLRIVLFQCWNALARAVNAESPRDFLTVEEAFLLALDRYQPEPYDSPAVLLRTEESAYCNPQSTTIWQRLVPRLDIVNVDGDHDRMFQPPHVKALAATIAKYLGDAKRDAGEAVYESSKAPEEQTPNWVLNTIAPQLSNCSDSPLRQS